MIVCLIRTVKKLAKGRGRLDQSGTKDTNMRKTDRKRDRVRPFQ